MVPRGVGRVHSNLLRQAVEQTDWPSACEPFYDLEAQEAGVERALLFGDDEVCAFATALSSDANHRPAPLFVGVASTVGMTAGSDVARAAVTLAGRLAKSYAGPFAGANEAVGAQLAASTFLSQRVSFSLQASDDASLSWWADALAAGLDWEGVTGVATSRMLVLGANVVVATEFEALRLGVAGRYDRAARVIAPMGTELQMRPEPDKVPADIVDGDELAFDSPPDSPEPTKSGESEEPSPAEPSPVAASRTSGPRPAPDQRRSTEPNQEAPIVTAARVIGESVIESSRIWVSGLNSVVRTGLEFLRRTKDD